MVCVMIMLLGIIVATVVNSTTQMKCQYSFELEKYVPHYRGLTMHGGKGLSFTRHAYLIRTFAVQMLHSAHR